MRVALTLGSHTAVFDEELDAPMELALLVQLDRPGSEPPRIEVTLDLDSNTLHVTEFGGSAGDVLNRSVMPLVNEFRTG